MTLQAEPVAFLDAPPPVAAVEAAEAETASAAGAVVLRLGASRYAVDMADVAEVLPVPPVTRVPGSPPWLTGVANWRGRVLPLVDVRPLLGAAVVPLASSARVLVLARGEVVAGLLAEGVPGVLDEPLDGAAPAPSTLTGDAAALVVAQVADRTGPLAVLDAGAVLALRERLERRR